MADCPARNLIICKLRKQIDHFKRGLIMAYLVAYLSLLVTTQDDPGIVAATLEKQNDYVNLSEKLHLGLLCSTVSIEHKRRRKNTKCKR